ncbi:MAG: CARDB domain-containing protein [Gaiellaceae bacterium]
MRVKPFTLVLFLASLVPAASAHAAPLAAVKLTSCQAGGQPLDRKATFVGHMRSVPGSDQLVMRFQLLEQYGGRKYTRVASPELRPWRRSHSGVQTYSYSQSVTGLVPGEAYRMQIQFRWLDSKGRTIQQVRRQSSVCGLAGDLPNLRVLDVTARSGLVPNTEAYTVDVMNAGLAPASRIGLQLVLDGATPDTATIDSLQPGEVRAIHFTGPGCRQRVRATIDPSDAIHESDESDDSLAGACPARG